MKILSKFGIMFIILLVLLSAMACGAGDKSKADSDPVTDPTEETPGTNPDDPGTNPDDPATPPETPPETPPTTPPETPPTTPPETPPTTPPTTPNVSVTGVTLNKSTLVLEVDDFEQLTATVVPENATTKTYQFDSSNQNVAVVSETGLVTAKNAGSAVITVTTIDGSKKATCGLRVDPLILSSVSISGNVNTYTLTGGTKFKAMLTPDIATSKTFPTGEDDSGTPNVPARFIMGETEVTYELWKEVYQWATTDAGGGKRADGGDLYSFANKGREGNDGTSGAAPTDTAKQEPVTYVNWRDTIVWCNALTEYYNANNGSETDLECVYSYSGTVNRDSKESNATACDGAVQSATAKGFRLPTSNEWEYAARYIGTSVPSHTNYKLQDGVYYTKGNSASGDAKAYNAASPTVGNYAVYFVNSGESTAVVKSKGANAIGLYDMSGNVWEWCFDLSGSSRVIRGGGYDYAASLMQVGYVYKLEPNYEHSFYGFRFCRNQ